MTEREIEIVLVEDNPAEAELTAHALGALGFQNMEILRDGVEALDFVFCRGCYGHRTSRRPPKLILLDLNLPKIDGLEVLKEVKSDPRTKAIPVVILTASKDEEDQVKGYHLGANSYLQKPVDFNRYREIVNHVGVYWLKVNLPPPPRAFLFNEASSSR